MSSADLQGGVGRRKHLAQCLGSSRDSVTVNLFFSFSKLYYSCTFTYPLNNIEKSKHRLFLNYKEDKHTLFIFNFHYVNFQTYTKAERMVYKSLRTYSSDSTFLPIWFHVSLPSFSLAEIFESKNPYLFFHQHYAMITLHKSNHNSLTVVQYPAPMHTSLKVSTMSFLRWVCQNEDPRTLIWRSSFMFAAWYVKWYEHRPLYLKEK